MELPTTFDNDRRFIFNNWSSEDFVGTWAGVTTIVKAGTTQEFPMYLAYHFTKHLVDREMARSGKASLMGNDDARKEYEDKTLAEITAGTDSPALSALKEQIRAEVLEQEKGAPKKGASKTTTRAVEATSSKTEFADIK
jgi:hypothetical protein